MGGHALRVLSSLAGGGSRLLALTDRGETGEQCQAVSPGSADHEGLHPGVCKIFFTVVEQLGDVPVVSNDILLKACALKWKISTGQTFGQTVCQVSPVAAMIDTWALTAQTATFFNQW